LPRAGSGTYVYSLDSIREYEVTSSSYSAELGQAAGGVVNAVTKSGANEYHGDVSRRQSARHSCSTGK
jgi:outer membrane receptor for ferrienterochelin and colicin